MDSERKRNAAHGNPHIGESFDSFLRDVGIYDDVMAVAIDRTVVLTIQCAGRKAGKGRAPRN
jgi:hypothetical protein